MMSYSADGQPAGLVQDVLGDGQLAHVVQQRRRPDRLKLALVLDDHRARQPQRLVLHPSRVVVRHLVFGIDGVRQRFDGADVHAVDVAQMADLILDPPDRVPESHVKNHRKREDEDQNVQRSEARQHHQQHRGEHPAEIGNPHARQVLAPDGENRTRAARS